MTKGCVQQGERTASPVPSLCGLARPWSIVCQGSNKDWMEGVWSAFLFSVHYHEKGKPGRYFLGTTLGHGPRRITEIERQCRL